MAARPEAALILLCGFSGSGKTALATRLAGGVPAVRLCPGAWMAALGIGLFDERMRGRLEGRLMGACPGAAEAGADGGPGVRLLGAF